MFEDLKIEAKRLGSEASAWATLRAHFKAVGCDIQRFEDKMTAGIPDANICYHGREIWLEGKELDAYPKRPGTPVRVGLKDAQVVWATKRANAGGRCFVWIREPRGWRLCTVGDYIPLRDGVPFAEYNQLGRLYSTSKELAENVLTLPA